MRWLVGVIGVNYVLFGVFFAFLFILQMVFFALASHSFLRVWPIIIERVRGRARFLRISVYLDGPSFLHLKLKSTNKSKIKIKNVDKPH